MSLREILTSPSQPWSDLIVDSVTSRFSLTSGNYGIIPRHSYPDSGSINLPASEIVNGYVSIGTRTGAGLGTLNLPTGSDIDTFLGGSLPLGASFQCLFVGYGSGSNTLIANTGCQFALGGSNVNLGSVRTQTLAYFTRVAPSTYLVFC